MRLHEPLTTCAFIPYIVLRELVLPLALRDKGTSVAAA
jgi:hypothetical protein